MTSRDFCYWLHGFFELADDTLFDLNTKQVDLIKKHLDLVFKQEIALTNSPVQPLASAFYQINDIKPWVCEFTPGVSC